MERISANGIDDVRDVKTIMVYECKVIDDEHGLMRSRKAFLRSVHMWDVRMAVESKYLACISCRSLLCPYCKKYHQSPTRNSSFLSHSVFFILILVLLFSPIRFQKPRTTPLSPTSPATKFRNAPFVLSPFLLLSFAIIIIRTRENENEPPLKKNSSGSPVLLF